ncbi:MAG TPA: hypothetical protein DEP69_07055, partial [Acidimicrobiaceae bacterium]|nr:hypothetical protein [Acidimicrobiaceae bacterium]
MAVGQDGDLVGRAGELAQLREHARGALPAAEAVLRQAVQLEELRHGAVPLHQRRQRAVGVAEAAGLEVGRGGPQALRDAAALGRRDRRQVGCEIGCGGFGTAGP